MIRRSPALHEIELLAEASNSSPDVVRLACLLPLVPRIEPLLIRNVRATFLPELTADVESQFWFSELVSSRNSKELVIYNRIAARFVDILRRGIAGAPDIDSLWSFSKLHTRHWTLEQRLERDLRYYALTEQSSEVRAVVKDILCLIGDADDDDCRLSLSRSVKRTLPVMSVDARYSVETRVLAQYAGLALADSGDWAVSSGTHRLPRWLEFSLPEPIGTASLGVEVFFDSDVGNVLHFAEPEPDQPCLRFSTPIPARLHVSDAEGYGKWHTVTTDSRLRLHVSSSTVFLTTLDGERWELHIDHAESGLDGAGTTAGFSDLDFWDAYDDWEKRIAQARRRGRVGDMLVLADEAPVSAFRASAWIRAGKALRRIGHFRFALEQLDKGLEIEPTDTDGLREKGMCLHRLAAAGESGYQLDMARTHYLSMLQRDDRDAETWALLGRVEKDAWIASWQVPDATPEQRIEDARYEKARLREAISCYVKAFHRDPKHYYSGVNALTLMHLYRHLTGEERYEDTIATMSGAVRFATASENDNDAQFWARASNGDLEILSGTVHSTEEAYQEAVATNSDNWFALDSCRNQLLLLRELGFTPDRVDAGIKVFDRAIARLSIPGREWEPRRVFLFTGHMVDAPDRETPRFPEDLVAAAGERIAELLRELDAGPGDLALTQGVCGGDLLFTEACQALDVQVSWQQPFNEPEFIQRSVVRCGEHWRQRYLDARQRLKDSILAAPDELGEPPAYAEPGYAYERCNLWLLYTALSWGIDKTHFVCLWNGGGGDGPGGTAHMYDQIAKRTGQVHWVDTRDL